MSILATTVMRETPSTPDGIPTMMHGRELAVATTLVMVDATTALLQGLLGPTTPEDHRAHHEIRTLLERVVAQQVESSMSQ